jgi:16S rRNA (cytosine967-C5)-methyltransferase
VALAERAGFVAAADLSRGRIRRVGENLARVGLAASAGLVVADARNAPFRPADAVLLDAPCTGTGTFRRHPDGRWRIGPAELGQLVELQRQLLESAAALVRPGGLLVYATCSLEPEENGDQVEAFLERHGEYVRETAEGAVDPSLLTARGELQVLPQRQGVDGSFAVRLRRTA